MKYLVDAFWWSVPTTPGATSVEKINFRKGISNVKPIKRHIIRKKQAFMEPGFIYSRMTSDRKCNAEHFLYKIFILSACVDNKKTSMSNSILILAGWMGLTGLAP